MKHPDGISDIFTGLFVHPTFFPDILSYDPQRYHPNILFQLEYYEQRSLGLRNSIYQNPKPKLLQDGYAELHNEYVRDYVDKTYCVLLKVIDKAAYVKMRRWCTNQFNSKRGEDRWMAAKSGKTAFYFRLAADAALFRLTW